MQLPQDILNEISLYGPIPTEMLTPWQMWLIIQRWIAMYTSYLAPVVRPADSQIHVLYQIYLRRDLPYEELLSFINRATENGLTHPPMLAFSDLLDWLALYLDWPESKDKIFFIEEVGYYLSKHLRVNLSEYDWQTDPIPPPDQLRLISSLRVKMEAGGLYDPITRAGIEYQVSYIEDRASNIRRAEALITAFHDGLDFQPFVERVLTKGGVYTPRHIGRALKFDVVYIDLLPHSLRREILAALIHLGLYSIILKYYNVFIDALTSDYSPLTVADLENFNTFKRDYENLG